VIDWTTVRRAAALALCACLAAAPARAVLIDSGDGTGNTTAPADDPGWSHVGQVGALNAVYLGYGWVATAAHVGHGPVLLGGTPYPDVPGSYRVITHAGSTLADLAVYRIDPYPYGLAALQIPTSPAPVGADVVMIGTGKPRGSSTQWMGIGGWEWLAGGQRRWGTNDVGAVLDPGPPVNTTDLTIGTLTTRALVADFSENAPGHEAVVTVGDSGGAFFVRDGAIWKLGGVSFALGPYAGQPASTSLYGNVTYAADLSYYREKVLAIARPCADGADNDSDAATDHPADPGCTWIGDLSELPDCGDGIDNDNDGSVDLADSYCTAAGDPREEPDADSDGVTDAEDNCLLAANSSQLDTNQDGYGNACDADFNDDGIVGGPDWAMLAPAFGATIGTPRYDAELDTNGDGAIGGPEFLLLGDSFTGEPGPSGLACAGTVPCP
jgi:hypothetical protein